MSLKQNNLAPIGGCQPEKARKPLQPFDSWSTLVEVASGEAVVCIQRVRYTIESAVFDFFKSLDRSENVHQKISREKEMS